MFISSVKASGLQVWAVNVDNAGMKTSLAHSCLRRLLVGLCLLSAPCLSAQEPGAGVNSKKPVKESRLWLPQSQAALHDSLVRAARQALLHPECNEVLYGSINEFRTQREGVSFTILCMRDSRSTFNQVFSEAELLSDVEIQSRATANTAAELERLRSLIPLPSVQPPAQPSTSQPEPEIKMDAGPAPVVF